MNTNVDLIGSDGKVQGELARYASQENRLDPNRLRPFIGKDGKSYISVYKGGDPEIQDNWSTIQTNLTNATLRKDEWKKLDEAVLRATDYRLGGIEDLVSAGLTYTLGNAMGTTMLEWHDLAGSLEGDMSMDAVTRALNNRPVWNYNYIPIPIIHVDYEINAREL